MTQRTRQRHKLRRNDWIGEALRSAYDEVLAEPVPEPLVAVCRRLDPA